MRSISNSEAMTWLKCRRRYYYAFDLGLAPKKDGRALTIGNFGHEILEGYYGWLCLHPGDWDGAKAAGIKASAKILSRCDTFQAEILAMVHRLLLRYFEYAAQTQTGWRILDVEKFYELPLVDDYKYAMKTDLRIQEGIDVGIVDHKFVYDFLTQDDKDLNPQLPKYQVTLLNNGHQVDYVALNEIRYRTRQKNPYTDAELFRMDRMRKIKPELQTHMREQIGVSREIVRHRNLDLKERDLTAYRTADKNNCRGCPFSSICITDLRGGDSSFAISEDFKKNDYDYNAKAEVIETDGIDW